MSNSDYPTASEFLPDDHSIDRLADAAEGCRGCPLYRDATQVVFGEGPHDADIVLVGEQPGSQEDRAGKPFVGPAGRILDRALDEAGLDRGALYITNAVKHFKSASEDGRRVGVKPRAAEIDACHPWLEAELQAVSPDIIVALGAVALRSLTGRSLTVEKTRRRRIETTDGRELIATYHPAAALRSPRDVDENKFFDALADDLRWVGQALYGPPPQRPRG